MKKRWIYRPLPPPADVEKLSAAIHTNPTLTTLLLQRGISDFDEARKFFNPTTNELHDPFLMKDMRAAVERLHEAISRKEKILIYGDYDVDGTTAVALVYRVLSGVGAHCAFYIPDRHLEGYGVSQKGIEFAEQNGFSLIIALDCGIKASEMVLFANARGIDFIICDHHLPDDSVPHAVAVLDPKQHDCAYPYGELSGCGLGFKLLQGYLRSYGDENILSGYTDLVAVSIASDIVPITGENRVLAALGLQKLGTNPLPGLKALKDISGAGSSIDVSRVVFTLGPRINAAGRMAHGSAAVELLVAETEEAAEELAGRIDLKNELRRQFDMDITQEALSMIGENEKLLHARSTVLFKEDWHKGVIGIVASRCIEHYYRPTIILTTSNGKVTGSARSIHGFDLYAALEKCKDLLDKFGGHRYAAGVTLDRANVAAFAERFEEVVAETLDEALLTPVIEIDGVVEFDQITPKFLNVLHRMAPFGPGNHNPVFEARNVRVLNSLSCFKDRHVRFIATQEGGARIFQAVGFDQGEAYDQLAQGAVFSMAFVIEENTYKGVTSTQLRIRDFNFQE